MSKLKIRVLFFISEWVSSMFYAIDSAVTLSDKEVKWRFFDFLYKYKTNVDLPMPNKQTKLMQYVQNGRLDIVKKLVSYTNQSSSKK